MPETASNVGIFSAVQHTDQHGYIGASTRGEIAYARRRHMPIDQRTIFVPPAPEIYYECGECGQAWTRDNEPAQGLCTACHRPVRVITVPGRDGW